MVADTSLVLEQALDRGETVLLEAGQATLLDVDHGTYPFVTSSNADRRRRVHRFRHPADPRRRGDRDPQGVHDPRRGGPVPRPSCSTTTASGCARPAPSTARRPAARGGGWLDTVIGRYANRINGVTDFVITKLDVLTGLDTVPVCVAYEVDGVRHDEMPMNQSDFHHATPVYELLDGWWEDISGLPRVRGPAGGGPGYVVRVEGWSARGSRRSGSAPAGTRSSAPPPPPTDWKPDFARAVGASLDPLRRRPLQC